jgi:DNA adenine methylase
MAWLGYYTHMKLSQRKPFLRYPGGKQKLLSSFEHLLPTREIIAGRYLEPMIGGGSVFFHIQPRISIISDVNRELIQLYSAIKANPQGVWNAFKDFPSSREHYYYIRDLPPEKLDEIMRAARTLYINRTCFKGMWRHNSSGVFNVGYGGEERRWVIEEYDLILASEILRETEILSCDFQQLVDTAMQGDFIFLDPPYSPSQRDMIDKHYFLGDFAFSEQIRLAKALKRASCRGVKWAMTNSSHHEILELYPDVNIVMLPKGTSRIIGSVTHKSGEALIRNYEDFS